MNKAGISLLAPLFLLAGVTFLTQAQELNQLNGELLASLKPAHANLETNLSRIAGLFKKGDILGARQEAGTLETLVQDKLRVIIVAERNRDVIPELEASGVEVEGAYQNLIQGLVPLGALENLTKIRGVNFIRPPLKPIPLVTSQGVVLTGADAYHTAGYTGQNASIAVLDLGFSGYSSLLETELPSSVIVKSFYGDPGGDGDITGGGEDHGTACAEIVYDMAFGAQLYLVNHNTEVEYANAVDWLITQGVDIISYSVGWVNAGPYDGTGSICDKVDDAYNNGILWVNSAGNQAERHNEGTFTDTDNDGWHEYVPGDETINISASGGSTIMVFLSWDDWPTSDQDYDLYLYDSSLSKIKAASTGWQTGTQEPTESISYKVPGSGSSTYTYHLVVREYSTTRDCHLEIYSFRHDLQHSVASSSLLIPADSANAFTAGATYWADDTLESFSSQGPTNGPGGGPAGGIIKPDICGPDGVDTSTYGPGDFYGTSASAPHVAGAAGITKSQFPSYTADQIQSALEGWAVDLGDPGKDNLFGSGRLALGDPTMVVLSSFTAMAREGKVTLIWRTEAEMDNVGFAIYRGETKDSNYTRIAFVNGAQDSETSNDYQFTDEQAKPGHTYYYYLEDVDLAGKRTKSDVIQVNLPEPSSVALPTQTEPEILPEQNSLLDNYPNPANPETWIPYKLAEAADVTIRFYDVRGHLIRTLHPGHQSAGFYLGKDKAAYWNGRDDKGEQVGSGVYFYRLSAGNFSAIRKMAILK